MMSECIYRCFRMHKKYILCISISTTYFIAASWRSGTNQTFRIPTDIEALEKLGPHGFIRQDFWGTGRFPTLKKQLQGPERTQFTRDCSDFNQKVPPSSMSTSAWASVSPDSWIVGFSSSCQVRSVPYLVNEVKPCFMFGSDCSRTGDLEKKRFACSLQSKH